MSQVANEFIRFEKNKKEKTTFCNLRGSGPTIPVYIDSGESTFKYTREYVTTTFMYSFRWPCSLLLLFSFELQKYTIEPPVNSFSRFVVHLLLCKSSKAFDECVCVCVCTPNP